MAAGLSNLNRGSAGKERECIVGVAKPKWQCADPVPSRRCTANARARGECDPRRPYRGSAGKLDETPLGSSSLLTPVWFTFGRQESEAALRDRVNVRGVRSRAARRISVTRHLTPSFWCVERTHYFGRSMRSRGTCVRAGGRVSTPSLQPAGHEFSSTIWNLVGYLVPLLVVLLTLPVTVSRLGIDRYGVLALVLVLHDYFGYLDFGLGRAATKELTSTLSSAADRGQSRAVLLISLALHFALGILLALLASAFVEPAAQFMFRGSPEILEEARATLIASLWFAPTLLLLTSARGSLEALRRFDLVNLVKVPSNVLTYLVPLAGAILEVALPLIVSMMVVVRFATALVYVYIALRRMPGGSPVSSVGKLVNRLLSFGGWIMLANLAGLVLVSGNRPLVSALASVSALAYYSVAQDVVSRLWILPASVSTVLFPSFAADNSMGRVNAARLYHDGVVYLIVLSFVPVFAALLCAREALTVWMGSDFSGETYLILSVLMVGVALDSVARVPLTLLQACGRPRAVAIVRLLLTPAFLIATYAAVTYWGVLGAAVVWSARIGLEAGLLFTLVSSQRLLPEFTLRTPRMRRTVIVTGLMAVASAVGAVVLTPFPRVRLATLLVLVVFFLAYSWIQLMDRSHRDWLTQRLLRPA